MQPMGYADPVTNDGTGFHLDARNFSLGTPAKSLPSTSLEPSRQVTLTQPLRSRRPRTGPPLCVHGHDITDLTAPLHDKDSCGSGLPCFHSGRMAKHQPSTGFPVKCSRYKTLQNKRILFWESKCYKVKSAHGRYKVQKPVTTARMVMLEPRGGLLQVRKLGRNIFLASLLLAPPFHEDNLVGNNNEQSI
jgi:hypothetical protein